MGTTAATIEQAITEHLCRHPLAADTALGVARWWLPSGLQDAPLLQVQEVLEALVRQGRLRQLPLGDGGLLYAAPTVTRQ